MGVKSYVIYSFQLAHCPKKLKRQEMKIINEFGSTTLEEKQEKLQRPTSFITYLYHLTLSFPLWDMTGKKRKKEILPETKTLLIFESDDSEDDEEDVSLSNVPNFSDDTDNEEESLASAPSTSYL